MVRIRHIDFRIGTARNFARQHQGVDAGEVGLSVAWTAVEDTTERPPRSQGEIVKDEDGSGANALTDFLASKKFI